MTVPGANLLAAALSIIGSQTVDYYAESGPPVTDAAGRLTPQYADAAAVRGSFQPLPLTTASLLGLDIAQSWAVFYAPITVIAPTRDHSGDQLAYFGRRYQVTGKTDWRAQDGWTALLCVDIGPA